MEAHFFSSIAWRLLEPLTRNTIPPLVVASSGYRFSLHKYHYHLIIYLALPPVRMSDNYLWDNSSREEAKGVGELTVLNGVWVGWIDTPSFFFWQSI